MVLAVEPLVQRSLARLLPDARFASANYVGAFWTRDNQAQIDLIGTEKDTANGRIEFAGSIKWRERKPFDTSDARELRTLAEQVPGWQSTTKLVGVSRTDFKTEVELDVALTPQDLLDAWRT
ncbi:MAG: hypothetical protein ACOCT8_05365 [Actinomycetota bacterium]